MNRILQYWPTAIVIAVIIYATWIPHPLPDADIPPIPHIDKLIHAIMFGGLTGSLLFDYRRQKPYRTLSTRIIMLFTIGAMTFGLIDEVVQGLLPIERPSDPLDLIADWAGSLIAVLTAPPLLRKIFATDNQ